MNGNPRIVVMIAIPTLIDTVRRIEILPFLRQLRAENAAKLGQHFDYPTKCVATWSVLRSLGSLQAGRSLKKIITY
jgi:hypothetical protein